MPLFTNKSYPIPMGEKTTLKCKDCTAVFRIVPLDNCMEAVRFCPNCGSNELKYK